MLDLYFKRPIFWDCIVSSVALIIVFFLRRRQLLPITSNSNLYSIVSDLSTIGLTMAGFVLTLLTVLISWKSTIKPWPTDEVANERTSLFDLFFSTPFYFETVKHLKWAIISLTCLSLIGFGLKLGLSERLYPKLYFFNVFGIIIIFLTIMRAVIILAQIIRLQQGK